MLEHDQIQTEKGMTHKEDSKHTQQITTKEATRKESQKRLKFAQTQERLIGKTRGCSEKISIRWVGR